MVRNLSEMLGYNIRTVDGEIGRCRDFLIDDDQWTVRHIVVDTGKWIPKKKVLMPPSSLLNISWRGEYLETGFTTQQVQSAPTLEEDATVSRKIEENYLKYWGWPLYWQNDPILGAFLGTRMQFNEKLKERKGNTRNSYVRSFDNLVGFHVSTIDDEFGRINDVIVEDESWNVTDLVVDTVRFLPSKEVLLPLASIKKFDWQENVIETDFSRDRITSLAPYSPENPINIEKEFRYYDYNGQPKPWSMSDTY